MSVNAGTPVSRVSSKRGLTWVKWDMRAYTMIGALVVLWLLFMLLSDSFLTPRNLSNLFLQMSVTSVLAIGMVLVIVAGQIDLSVGSIVGLTGGIAAILNVWLGWNTVAVIVIVVLTGIAIGFIQGWWVAYRAVPAFIVTLGGMLVFRGILIGITESKTIAPLSPGMKFIGQAYITPALGLAFSFLALVLMLTFSVMKRTSRIKNGFEVEPLYVTAGKLALYAMIMFGFVLVMNSYQGIPLPFITVIVLALLFTFIAKQTVFGRQVFAIGGNPEAARLSGIDTKKRIVLVFVLCNMLAAIAGLILTARINAATSSAGATYELDAIAACVIGGTSLLGGAGTIVGAMIGALVMATLDNGMSIMSMDSFWQNIVKGSILVLAVWVDMYSRQKKKT